MLFNNHTTFIKTIHGKNEDIFKGPIEKFQKSSN